MWLFLLRVNTLPPSQTLPRTGLLHADPGEGLAHKNMQAQIQGDTHQHTQNHPASYAQTHPQRRQMCTEVSHSSTWRAAHAHTPTHPQRCRGCNLHQPPWRYLEDCQEGWGELVVFSPSLPCSPHTPLPAHPVLLPSTYQLMEGVSYLEGGSGSFAAICPFPRLRSAPSGLCCGGLGAWGGGGAGVQMQKGNGGGGGKGWGRQKSVQGF